MSSQDLCELLPWDSGFFGHRVARAVPNRLDAAALREIESWCRAKRIEALYLLADIGDPPTAALAEQAGFRLVDVRVTLGRRLAPPAEPDAPTPPLRPARPEDLFALRALAAVSHRDSRFYADPRFARERCDELYATWIEKSCADAATAVWLAESEGAPAGYVTARLLAAQGESPARGEIGLIAVADRAQGRGLGGQLITRALSDLAARGAARVSVVTQGRNVRAQRLYQRFGFSTEALGLWFHRWFD